jgi:ceramide glucosyltransferase
LAGCIVEHHLPDYSFVDYLRHQLRWARSIRDSRPRGYVGLILTFGIPWAMLGVIVSPFAAWAWALLALTLIVRCMVAFTIGFGVLRDREVLKQLWWIPLRDLAAVGIWAGSLVGRRIVWRGNVFTLENGKLRP